MAQITSNASNGYQLIFEITQTGQNTSKNTSDLSWTLSFKCTNSYWMASTYTASVVIDGETVWTEVQDSPFNGYNQTKQIASGTTTVKHDANGTKTVGFSMSFERKEQNQYMPESMSGSGSLELTKIPIASEFTLSNVLEIGQDYTVDLVPADSTFSHSLDIFIGGKQISLISDIKAGVESQIFTVPTSLSDYVENGNSVSARVRFSTWAPNGSKWDFVGYRDEDVTLEIAGNPTISSVKVTDPTGYYSKYGGYVKHQSRLSVQISAAGVHGSSVSVYQATVDGQTYTGSSSTLLTNVLNTSGTLSVVSVVTDSRGNASSANTTKITVLDYNPPAFSSCSVIRSDGGGNASDSGTYLKVTGECAVSDLSAKNPGTLTVSYREKGTEAWTVGKTVSAVKGTYKINAVIGGSLDPEKIYEVELSLKDGFGTSSVVGATAAAFKLISFGAGKKSIAFGKTSSDEGKMEIAMEVDVTGDLTVSGKIHSSSIPTVPSTASILQKAYPVGSVYISTSNKNPKTLFGFGTWTAIEGRVLIGAGTYNDGTDSQTFEAGESYGTYRHTLTENEMPRHYHDFVDTDNKDDRAYTFAFGAAAAKTNKWVTDASYKSTGSTTQDRMYTDQTWYGTQYAGNSQAHNNIQPSLAVYIWQRTA